MHVAFRKSTLACTIAALWGTAGADALAQQAEALPEPLRIEVTGSHIARIDGERALPVQIIRREEIERGNWTTAAELMSYVSANFGQMNNALSVASLNNPTNVGLSGADLRGIGGGLTLVLLNGRRLSNYAFLSGTVDLGKIPLAAIDRVEILKDGASSIYGTDAIAGVVNFITRKDYSGVSVTGQAGFTEHGGGDHYQATITAGWGDLAKDKFNAFVTFDWQKDTALVAADRAFAATGYLPDEGINSLSRATFPANIRKPSGTFVNPVAAMGCQPPGAVALQGRPECFYDPVGETDLLPGQEQWNAIGRATWEWTAGQQLFAEIVYSRSELELGWAPTAASRGNTNQVPVIYPSVGPHYPTEFANANGLSGPLEVYLRTTEIGRRISTVDSEGQRLMLGGQGTVAGWDYDAAYTYSVNTATYGLTSGYVTTPGLMGAMGTGLVNPFGPSGPVGLDLLKAAQYSGTVRDAKGTLNQVDFNVSRDLMQLSGGPLAIAFGGEFRREALTDSPSPLLADQQIVGVHFEINPQDASRTVGAVFAEVNVPIVRGLEAGASVRFDDYNDFGTTTNPKVALRWQALPSLLFRGSWGTGFHAPSLPQIFTPVSGSYVSNSFFVDPVRCPVTDAPEDCGGGEYLYVQGGSRSLAPETSTQFGVGSVWEPVPGISIGLDWWRIDVSNLIGNYGPGEIFQDYDRLSSTNVVRGAPLPGQPDLPGPIVALIGTNENLASLVTSGVDVTFTARYADPSAGTFRLSLTGTYVHVFDFTPDGGTTASVVGTDGGLGPVPRWRHYAELSWQRGPWGASLAQLFQTGYVDQNRVTTPPRNVGTYSLWNLQGIFAGFRNWSIAAGIRNLFDTDPPFSNQISTAQVGYDPYSADPRGRTFYARVSYAFK